MGGGKTRDKSAPKTLIKGLTHYTIGPHIKTLYSVVIV